MQRHNKRLQQLESHTVAMQRRDPAALAALCAAGKLSVVEMTDAELEMIIAAGLPGEVDVRQLSDDELYAILDS